MGDPSALVSRARAGDAEAFGAVVRCFQDMAVGYGYALLRADWTALHYAAGYGFIDLLKAILSRTTDINARDEEGKTPLRVAIEEKQEAAAELLRKSGAQE